MKKIKIILLSCICSLSLLNITKVKASEYDIKTEYLGNGIYLETYIEENEMFSTNTKTGTKTANYKNAAGDILFWVKVKGVFTYTGKSSKCTSSSVEAKALASNWKVSNSTSSKSNNTAIATTTGKRYMLGIVVETRNEKVQLSCSANGKLS